MNNALSVKNKQEKSVIMHIFRESKKIYQERRRDKGNMLILALPKLKIARKI